MTADPVATVTESEATGEIASIYAQIRTTLGSPVVNLVWRRLAKIEGGLAWAWQTVRPLYEDHSLTARAQALKREIALSPLEPIPPEALRAAGVDAAGATSIRDILAAFDYSNPLNYLALSALLRSPGGANPAPVELAPGTDLPREAGHRTLCYTFGGEPNSAFVPD